MQKQPLSGRHEVARLSRKPNTERKKVLSRPALRMPGRKQSPFETISPQGIPALAADKELLQLVTLSMARKYRVWPISRKGDHLLVGMADPADFNTLDELQMITRMRISGLKVQSEVLDRILDEASISVNSPWIEGAAEGLDSITQDIKVTKEEEPLESHRDPVVRLVNSLLQQAVLCGASDIHLEPEEKSMRIRFRIDGELTELAPLPSTSTSAILSRIKILAGLDITEKRRPQDGLIRQSFDNREVGFRVATLPAITGEKIVLRVLDQQKSLLDLDGLELGKTSHALFSSLLRHREGLILITGPTGAGKTSTLYAMLNQLNCKERNIITLEDPVEFVLPGLTQVAINHRSGIGFAEGLRRVLRVDPDIIMVGEIRDTETAHLAVQASVSGHLVLATLHTVSASGAVTRLLDMGVEPYLLGASLIGVVCQRLVRVLCAACRENYLLPERDAIHMGIPPEYTRSFWRSRGCHRCGYIGYRGRQMISEILVVDQEIKSLLSRGALESEIDQAARKKGFISLLEDGLFKVSLGITSLEEILGALSYD